MRKLNLVRAAALAATGVLTLSTLVSPAAAAHSGGYTFAVIGDIPYGDAAIARFPANIAQINADPAVQWVDHLGDIKNGSSVCSDDYFQLIKSDFDQVKDPLVYTIGDNEWTDCHRPNNGPYDPLERLGKVRQVFFPQPGRTLGQRSVRVEAQTDWGLPENVRWSAADVEFAAVHIVGSNNSLAPWTGKTAPTPEQTAEVLNRTAGDIAQIHETFAAAGRDHRRAVVLLTQADMFDPTVANPAYADYYGFQPIVAAIVREAAAFRGPVYLFNGDSHVFNVDHPLADGSSWLAFYGVTRPLANLTRITVDGSSNANDYLRVTVNRHGPQVLSWTKVPFTAP
ncbi:hypothetical protein ACQP2F_17940 [Actinoplanes sp. CA-030573]|uniref:hypothetical protein n=1 Tax=Actinoplanes sp. CA-030573 TaxID=3239898 RepID=UPI003D8A92C5